MNCFVMYGVNYDDLEILGVFPSRYHALDFAKTLPEFSDTYDSGEKRRDPQYCRDGTNVMIIEINETRTYGFADNSLTKGQS